MSFISLEKKLFRKVKGSFLALALLVSYACWLTSKTVTPLDESKPNIEVQSQTPPLEKPISPPVEKTISPPLEKTISPPLEKPISPPVEKTISPPLEKTISPPVEKPIRPSSEQTLRNYYQALNDYNYLSAWGYLTSEVQSEGYQTFLNWWSKVKKIDVLSLELGSEEDEYNSTVDSRLQYFTKSGRQINQILRFDMVWDTVSDRWLINKIERLALLD